MKLIYLGTHNSRIHRFLNITDTCIYSVYTFGTARKYTITTSTDMYEIPRFPYKIGDVKVLTTRNFWDMQNIVVLKTLLKDI